MTTLLCVLTLFIGNTISPTHAASLRISPIGLDLPASQRAASFTLANTADEPVNLQLRAFQWRQVNGQDILEPASDLMVSPPAVTVPPNASYTVRVARTTMTPVATELSYRLLIDELPQPSDPRTVAQNVAIILRTSLPVFFSAPKAKADLHWRLWLNGGSLYAEVTNSGDRHAKISGLSVMSEKSDRQQTYSFGSGLNGYVLAGARKRFELALPKGASAMLTPGASVKLTARDSQVDIAETLQLAAP